MILLTLAVLAQNQVHPPPAPHFIGKSGAIVRAMETALNHLGGREIVIQSEDGRVKLTILKKRIREDQATMVWAHNGKTLTLRDAVNRRFYSGKCPRNLSLDYVANATHRRVDPFTRDILIHRTPLTEGLAGTQVKLAGFVSSGGMGCDIVVAQNAHQRTTYFVRRSDHMPISVTSETLLGQNTVSRFVRRFRYRRVNSGVFTLFPEPGDKIRSFKKPHEAATVKASRK